MKLAIFVLILGPWAASFANGTGIDGKLIFPDESSYAEKATPVSVNQSEIQALVRSYLRVLADAPDAPNAVRPAAVRSPYTAAAAAAPAAAAQTDALCDGPCPTSSSVAKSAALNTATLQPALCDAQGRCYLTLDPSYNVSDKDLGTETPIVPVIPIVPVYKGVAKGSDTDNGKNPSQDSDKEVKPANRTYVQFVRKLIPNYDFPVVPVYQAKNEVKIQHPYNVNNRKLYGVSYPVTKVHQPSVFPSTVSYRPPFNVGPQHRPTSSTGRHRPGSTHSRYPYPYGRYGVHTRHNQGWTYLKSVGSLQSNSQGWVNVGPRGQSTGSSDYQGTGTLREVKGTGSINRNGCSSRCPGVMEHKGGSVSHRETSFNISGKLEFPKDGEGTAALRSEIHIDGKLGAM